MVPSALRKQSGHSTHSLTFLSSPIHTAAGIPLMSILISALVTFLVVILVLYLVNMLPIDGRAKQIVQVIVIIIGVISLLRLLAVF
jgi:hypothetical protein